MSWRTAWRADRASRTSCRMCSLGLGKSNLPMQTSFKGSCGNRLIERAGGADACACVRACVRTCVRAQCAKDPCVRANKSEINASNRGPTATYSHSTSVSLSIGVINFPLGPRRCGATAISCSGTRFRNANSREDRVSGTYRSANSREDRVSGTFKALLTLASRLFRNNEVR